MLPHERMPVYRRALGILEQLEPMARALPHDRADLRAQLRSAAESIVFNIAEGAGEYSPGDKGRFYRMARRSAAELGAGLDIMRATLPDVPDIGRLKTEVVGVVAELDKLVFLQQRRR